MTFDERVNALSALPDRARFAFAAECAQRALAEAEHLVPNQVADHPALRKGLELLWRQAMQADVDYGRDARDVHQQASQLIPASEDDPEPDKALLYAAQAVSLGLLALKELPLSPKRIALAGGAMMSLVGNVYDDLKRVQNEEKQWEDRAIQFLAEHPDTPITPKMFDSLPEYDRGAISERYRKGLKE
jgi:hypothetical protein